MVYGASILFLEQSGWGQINISSAEVNRQTLFHQVTIVGGVLEEECNKLFASGPPAGGDQHALHSHGHDAHGHDTHGQDTHDHDRGHDHSLNSLFG